MSQQETLDVLERIYREDPTRFLRREEISKELGRDNNTSVSRNLSKLIDRGLVEDKTLGKKEGYNQLTKVYRFKPH